MATIIDGKALAARHSQETAKEVQALKSGGIRPGLCFVVVGGHPASQIYVRNKQRACDAVGIQNFLDRLPEDISEPELLSHIEKLNDNPEIHGILVQLPLPVHLDTDNILFHINPRKDVDGLHPDNLGKLYTKRPGLRPCTPQGVLSMIESTGVAFDGLDACVVGRSAIVGRPSATLLVHRDCTVTLCHSHTRNLPEKTAAADILVAAIGVPKGIRGNWIKKGAVVIDVGINRLPDGTLCGDVDFEEAEKRAGFISPVPGGVGPMTVAMLLSNTVQACKMSLRA